MPLSRTHTYKKITKPLLERKRRARINKCLDELKDIMTGDFSVAIVATSITNADKVSFWRPIHQLGSINTNRKSFTMRMAFGAAEELTPVFQLPCKLRGKMCQNLRRPTSW